MLGKGGAGCRSVLLPSPMPAQATWPHDGARRRSLLQMGREREEGEASARGGEEGHHMLRVDVGSRGACGMARPRKERNRAYQTTQGVLEEARQNGNIRCPSEMSQFMTSNNKPDSSRKRSQAREDEREVGRRRLAELGLSWCELSKTCFGPRRGLQIVNKAS